MPLTHFRFAWDGRPHYSMDVRNISREPATIELCRSTLIANEWEESLGQNLDHFWIDLGGEG